MEAYILLLVSFRTCTALGIWVSNCVTTLLAVQIPLILKGVVSFHLKTISSLFVTLFSCLNGFLKVFGQIWDVEPTNLDLGMKLLYAIKDLGLNISRTSLDFLLSACVKAKDSKQAQKIWTEYESASLPHNVLTSLRLNSLSRTLIEYLLKTPFSP